VQVTLYADQLHRSLLSTLVETIWLQENSSRFLEWPANPAMTSCAPKRAKLHDVVHYVLCMNRQYVFGRATPADGGTAFVAQARGTRVQLSIVIRWEPQSMMDTKFLTTAA
jgi:hypothetical protein